MANRAARICRIGCRMSLLQTAATGFARATPQKLPSFLPAGAVDPATGQVAQNVLSRQTAPGRPESQCPRARSKRKSGQFFKMRSPCGSRRFLKSSRSPAGSYAKLPSRRLVSTLRCWTFDRLGKREPRGCSHSRQRRSSDSDWRRCSSTYTQTIVLNESTSNVSLGSFRSTDSSLETGFPASAATPLIENLSRSHGAKSQHVRARPLKWCATFASGPTFLPARLPRSLLALLCVSATRRFTRSR